MYNLHCHSLLSDGVLLPSEIARRYAAVGYKVIAITDHADYSNFEFIVSSIINFTRHWPKNSNIKVLPGIELTHLPPEHFKPLSKLARKKGIKIIVAHGETTMEPVFKGTNRAALGADIDILAHPGFITDQETRIAREKGIFLEVTSRLGHANTNIHVVKQAKKHGAKLILSHDAHQPEDIIPPIKLAKIGLKAGLNQADLEKIARDVQQFIKKTLDK